ncbi:MAG: anthranilate phosphoribosyltransferase [Gammaproteobacteria bacterium]|nr:anthranilate phosphoribosyltransferase [Gammaproteobacteria bacterium]
MDMKAAISAVTDSRDLNSEEMTSVMRLIMTGQATEAQIGGFLIGMRMKGETVDELAAAAQVMRDLATPVALSGDHLVDTCGTGGDGLSTFNISTASAFVVAAAGGQVAKHGNRSVSSSCGSADVLETAGVNLDLEPAQVAQCVNELGVGFLFAPHHHSAMKHAIGPRKEMGVRTLFNLLGPLTNPATAPNQVLGVFSEQWLKPLAQVLQRLGSHHVLVVHADDGLDEISISAATQVAELRDGEIRCYSVTPEQFGLQRGDAQALVVANADKSLAMIKSVFAGDKGAARDIVLLNAGAAIYAANLVDSLQAGVVRAAELVDSGAAGERLAALVRLTQSM